MHYGKPHNNGQILSIRISNAAHESIAYILAVWAREGRLPSLRTKGLAVEAAVNLLATQLTEGAPEAPK